MTTMTTRATTMKSYLVFFLSTLWFGDLLTNPNVAVVVDASDHLVDFSKSAHELVDLQNTIDEFLHDQDNHKNEEEDRNLRLFNNNNNDPEEVEDQEHAVDLGGRCWNTDQCKEGLECDHFAAIAGGRCVPRRDCMTESIQTVLSRPQFEGNNYKDRLLDAANVTELDVFNAFMASVRSQNTDAKNNNGNESMPDLAAFQTSQPMEAIRKAIEKTVYEDFGDLQPMMKRCVEPEQQQHDQNRDLLFGLFGGGGGDEQEQQQQLQVNGDEDETDPTQAEGQFPAVFIGAHIEVGAGIGASFTTVWQVTGGSVTVNQRVAGRVCAGVEIGAIFALTFIVAVGFTNDVRTLDCLHVLIDLDLEAGVGLGLDYGFCVPNPTTQGMYVAFTIGVGIGGSLGVAACNIYPFV